MGCTSSAAAGGEKEYKRYPKPFLKVITVYMDYTGLSIELISISFYC